MNTTFLALLGIGWAVVGVLLLCTPLAWVARAGLKWLVRRLARPAPQGVPCPKCGYDCRVFDARQKSHRCPECGVELRWGQLA